VIAPAAWRTETTGEFPLFSGPDGVQFMWVDNATLTAPKRVKIFGHIDQILAVLPTGGSSLAPTALKTANYTAVANDLVLADISAASWTVTLPTPTSDKVQIGVQVAKVQGAGVTGTFTLTIARTGSDVFKVPSGPTSLTANQLEYGVIFQYALATHVWTVVDQSLSPTTQAGVNNLTYAALGANDRYLAFAIGDTVVAGMPVLTQELYFPASTPITDALISAGDPEPRLRHRRVHTDRLEPGNRDAGHGRHHHNPGGRRDRDLNGEHPRVTVDVHLRHVVHLRRRPLRPLLRVGDERLGYWGAAPQLHLLQSGTFTLPRRCLRCRAPSPPPRARRRSPWRRRSRRVRRRCCTSTRPRPRRPRWPHRHRHRRPRQPRRRVVAHLRRLLPRPVARFRRVVVGHVRARVVTFAQFNAVTGGPDPAKWAFTLGTNSGTTATVDGSSYLITTSGAVGSGAVQDRVYGDYIELGSTAVYSAARLSEIQYYQYQGANQFLLYLSRNAFTTLATSFTTGIQFQFNASGVRVGIKTGGSFIILTASGSTQATATSSDASGVVPWSVGQTADSTHQYGATVEALPTAGDGTQVINVYTGTTAAATDGSTTHGSLTLLTAVTLTSAQRSAIPAGHIGYEQDGANSTGATQTTRIKFKVATLSPVGT
jgi:hypothetical protein